MRHIFAIISRVCHCEADEGRLKQSIFWAATIALFLFLPLHASAQTKEIVSEGAYTMSDGETPSVAESRALLNAKRVAVEQARTYVESRAKVDNFQLTEDEIQVLAAEIMEVETLDKKRTIGGDGIHFWVKIKAKVNPDKIQEMTKRVKGKSVIQDYKNIQETYDKSQKDIEEIKKQLTGARGEGEKKQAEARITDDEKLFKANEWFEKGLRHTVGNEDGKGIQEYTNAIALNPDYAEAYNNRGIAYYNQGLDISDQDQIVLAIKDFRKVIVLKPGSYSAYFAQGVIYIYEEEYARAIEELNKAIVMDPDEDVAYVGRGFIYMQGKNKDPAKAVADFNRVIDRGGIWSGMAYANRGGVLMEQQQYDMALDDYNKAIELSPRNAKSYLVRGLILAFKKQFSLALEDLNLAIELNPKSPDAYLIRGTVYAEIGNPTAAADFQKACDMGSKQGCINSQRALKNR